MWELLESEDFSTASFFFDLWWEKGNKYDIIKKIIQIIRKIHEV